MKGAGTNPLELSDEDFLNMNGPPAGEEDEPKAGADEEEQKQEDPAGSESDDGVGDEGNGSDAEKAEETDETSTSDTDEESDEDGSGSDDKPTTPKGDDAEGAAGGAEAAADGKKPVEKSDEEKPKDEKVEEVAKTSADYETFYKQVMAPFKANGKTIQLQSPDEVIQLMQMGANYTKKLQDIQPHRKVLLMLQNNDLLDEGKLSYLIDLDKKDPEAIRKLVKDAGIDPMDIDVESEPNYSGGNHKVSDEEARFRDAVEGLGSLEKGSETLQTINSTWDQASKELLWTSPEVMAVIHTQRENGIYSQITAEMDRQITLGQIPPNTPFLQAYQMVGDAMAKAGAFGQPQNQDLDTPAVPGRESEALAERAAVPRPKVKSGDKASAASPSRSAPSKKAETLVNPLQMSDDEFLKNFANRL